MSHALDSFNANFDETGKYQMWWSAKDFDYFHKIQTNVVEQLVHFAKLDNVRINGWKSVNQVIADISGIRI
jgi:predicted metalloendopeptidase